MSDSAASTVHIEFRPSGGVDSRITLVFSQTQVPIEALQRIHEAFTKLASIDFRTEPRLNLANDHYSITFTLKHPKDRRAQRNRNLVRCGECIRSVLTECAFRVSHMDSVNYEDIRAFRSGLHRE